MPLGVAVVGLGVGEQHARAYPRTGRCALRWLYDVDRGKATRLASELGSRPAESLEQILSDPGVDILSIASYDDAHAGQVVAGLEAGKHIFVEKPLCRTADEARQIKRWWLSTGRRLSSNLVLRGAPLYRWLRDAIAAGRLGTIYAFDGDYLYGRLHKLTDGWRGGVDEYSVVHGGAIHLIDLMLGLTGERPVSATAAGNRLCTAGSSFRYHDFVAATYRFPSGMVGRITANFGCVHRHQHIVRVFGTEGTFVYDDRGARFHLTRDPDAAPLDIAEPALPVDKGVLIPGFVDAVAGGAGPDGEQQEFDVISLCTAAVRALASGGEEPIEYI